jgi:hypothetical protein
MKHTKRAVATVLFAFLILGSFTNCEEKKKEQEGDDDPKEEEVVDPPEQIVSLEQAKETYDNYSERRVGLIEESERPKEDGSKFEATRYTYYDYGTIKQYLAYIEQEAKQAGVEISSLRFYFSNYPDSTSFADGREVIHPRQNSIFLIPATEKEGLEYPFILEDKDGKWEPFLLTGQLDPYGQDQKGMGLNPESRTKAYAGFIPASETPYTNMARPNLNHHLKSTVLNYGGSAPPPNQ